MACCNDSIKGGELFEFIETEGRVDEDVTVRLLRQVLEGVEFLHSQNILHMDIKVNACNGLMILQLHELKFFTTCSHGGDPPAKPRKVLEFHIGQGKVWEICGLPVMCYHSCDGHKISYIIQVLLSKIYMHKMDCHPQYSLRSTHRHVCVALVV